MSSSQRTHSGHEDRPGVPPGEVSIRRVLLIGSSDELASLHDELQQRGIDCTLTPTYLTALGELTRRPSDILIGPADAWQGSPESIVDTVHTLAPGIRLLAWADPDRYESGEHAIRAGFDQVVPRPTDERQARQVVNLLLDANVIPPTQKQDSPTADRQEWPATEDHVDSSSPSDQPTDLREDIGDVDLIDALLQPGTDVVPLALKMIESHSGWKGVGLRPSDGQPPDGHVSVPVSYRGRTLGLLHAPPPADAHGLTSWADWLSRWLALREQLGQLRDMAMRDELTGVWNRRYFNRFLDRILKKAAKDRSQVTLLVFDIDDFKLYNDKYGHGTGDEVLREAARLMQSVVREHDVVARIGGDEFAVIFWDNEKPRRPNSSHPQDVMTAAQRFQEAICSHRFPKLMDQAVGRLTVSGGLASFPWDGQTPDELLARADAMALQSKRQGKNAITFGTGARRACRET